MESGCPLPPPPPPPPPLPPPPPCGPPPPGPPPPGPPPPPGIGLITRQGRQGSKMRNFNWDTIPTHSVVGKHNIWTEQKMLSEFELDTKRMEELFSRNEQAQLRVKALHRQSMRGQPTSGPGTEGVSLLNSKRSMNIGIFLKQFKRPVKDMIKDIHCGEGRSFEKGKLADLCKLLPEEAEVKQLTAFSGDQSALPEADLFMFLLVKVPSYVERLNILVLKEEFFPFMDEMKQSIVILSTAGEELLQTSELHSVFGLVLKTGNYMNAGGYAGKAVGFRIASLLKLVDTKANKPGMNLMHYVVMQAQKVDDVLLKFPDKLPHIAAAARLRKEEIEADFEREVKKVRDAEAQAEKQEDLRAQTDDFLKEAEARLSDVRTSLQTLNSVSDCVAEYFCEDPAKFKLEECCSIFHSFCEKFTRAIQENKEREVAEVKRRHRDRLQSATKRRSTATCSVRDKDMEGVALESMLQKILTGRGSRRKRGTPSPTDRSPNYSPVNRSPADGSPTNGSLSEMPSRERDRAPDDQGRSNRLRTMAKKNGWTSSIELSDTSGLEDDSRLNKGDVAEDKVNLNGDNRTADNKSLDMDSRTETNMTHGRDDRTRVNNRLNKENSAEDKDILIQEDGTEGKGSLNQVNRIEENLSPNNDIKMEDNDSLNVKLEGNDSPNNLKTEDKDSLKDVINVGGNDSLNNVPKMEDKDCLNVIKMEDNDSLNVKLEGNDSPNNLKTEDCDNLNDLKTKDKDSLKDVINTGGNVSLSYINTGGNDSLNNLLKMEDRVNLYKENRTEALTFDPGVSQTPKTVNQHVPSQPTKRTSSSSSYKRFMSVTKEEEEEEEEGGNTEEEAQKMREASKKVLRYQNSRGSVSSVEQGLEPQTSPGIPPLGASPRQRSFQAEVPRLGRGSEGLARYLIDSQASSDAGVTRRHTLHLPPVAPAWEKEEEEDNLFVPAPEEAPAPPPALGVVGKAKSAEKPPSPKARAFNWNIMNIPSEAPAAVVVGLNPPSTKSGAVSRLAHVSEDDRAEDGPDGPGPETGPSNLRKNSQSSGAKSARPKSDASGFLNFFKWLGEKTKPNTKDTGSKV